LCQHKAKNPESETQKPADCHRAETNSATRNPKNSSTAEHSARWPETKGEQTMGMRGQGRGEGEGCRKFISD